MKRILFTSIVAGSFMFCLAPTWSQEKDADDRIPPFEEREPDRPREHKAEPYEWREPGPHEREAGPQGRGPWFDLGRDEERFGAPGGRPGKFKHHAPKPDFRGGRAEYAGMLRRLKGATMDYLAWLRTEEPEEFRRLMDLRERDSALFAEVMQDRLREWQHLRRLKRNDPELAEKLKRERDMDREAIGLGEAYRNAETGEEKEEIRAALKQLLSELFDLRESHRKARVREVEKELEELRRVLKERRENKESIIQKRLEQLTGENAHLNW